MSEGIGEGTDRSVRPTACFLEDQPSFALEGTLPIGIGSYGGGEGDSISQGMSNFQGKARKTLKG